MARPEVNVEAYSRAETMVANGNLNDGSEVVAKQGFKLEEHPGSERLVGRVRPTTVYEAPKPRRRRRAQ